MTPSNSASQLASFVERLVNIEETAKEVAADRKELLLEAKEEGYNPKALQMLAKRRMESEAQKSKRLALEEAIALYKSQLGELADTDLGRAALGRLTDTLGPGESMSLSGGGQKITWAKDKDGNLIKS